MKLPISIFILIAIVLGLIFPKGTLIKFLFYPLLFTLMYFSVLKIELKVKSFFRKEIAYWALINILLLPVIAYFAGHFLPEYLLLGVVIAALAPTAMNAPIFVKLVNGNKELSVSISTIANLSAIFYIPLMLFFLFGLRLEIPYAQTLVKLFVLVLVPLLLAILTRKILVKGFSKLTDFSERAVPLLLFLFLWITVSTSANQVMSAFREVLLVVPVVILVSAAGFLLGYLIVRKPSLKRTLAISGGYKNQSLMLGLIYSINPLVVIPPTIYLLVHHIFNSVFVWLAEKEKI